MDGKNTVHAPYNFISFAESPWLPYQSMDDLPPHDRIDPQRRTGELHITLTAETPVFVAGEKGRSPGDASRFFRTPDGALAIPGSTIRGLTRENMQILSFAPVRVGEDIAENEDSGRKGYKFPIADGLPPKYKELTDVGPLDCPSAILGFSRGRLAYRSRVSFGDFVAEAGAREGAPVRMILGEPKPGYYPGYLRPAQLQSGVKHYNDDDFRLRGFKQYWLKDTQKTDVPPGKEKVGTALCPLPAGTRFHGVVRFKNLSDAELGLLVWSLCLDEGCYQNVGMGKPYGYGRMSVRVERMVEFAPDDLYGGSLCPAPSQKTDAALQKAVRDCISAYEREATAALGGAKKRPLREMSAIRDFLYMKSAVQEGGAFGYMDLREYKNTRAPLPSAGEIRRAQSEQAPSRQQPATVEEKEELLLQKFGRQQQQRRKR